MKTKIYILLVTLSLLFTACVKEPDKPDTPDLKSGQYLVLCEGLMGHNNSSISLIDIESNQIQNLYFETANGGLKIGDTANDLVFKNDTAFVTVTLSGSIESFRNTDGKWLNRLYIEGSSPNKTVIINDTVAYATDMLNDSTLIKYNPKNMEYISSVPFKGKNPVDITTDGKRLFVANSGFGIYYYNHKYAGKLSVLDLETEEQIDMIDIGTNLIEIKMTDEHIYLCYYNLYEEDAPGGIVELDLETLKETNRIEGFFRYINYSPKNNRLYFVEDIPGMDIVKNRGVSFIDLNKSQWEVTQVIKNNKANEFWYALTVDDETNRLLVGNAMNFSVSGKVMIFRADTLEYEYQCGVNPSAIRILR